MTPDETLRWLFGEITRFFAPQMIALEWFLLGLLAFVVACAPLVPWPSSSWLKIRFRRMARSGKSAVLLCGALPIVLRLALLGVMPAPIPSIHDEFSQLLLADTLAHGRLTNPPHPMWRHFESIHIIQHPTYNSMYPPGQAVFLAFGQVVFRHPWAGVLVSVGLMFAAFCWMMRAWLPPEWALFGTLIAILQFGVVGFWTNGYFNASAPAIGGALLLGALPAVRRSSATLLTSVLLGLGLVLLLHTRPVEGGLLGFLALLYIFSPKGEHPWRLRMVMLWPAAAILLAGVLFAGYYSWRVTGHPLQMPYQVNRDTYGWPENLGFLPPKHVQLTDSVLRRMYEKEIAHRDIYKSISAYLDNLSTKLYDNWTFFVGPILTPALLFLGWMFFKRRIRPLMILAAAILGLNLFQMVLYPYHLAPIVPILFVALTQGVRIWYVGIRKWSPQAALALLIALPFCIILVSYMKQDPVRLSLDYAAYWDRGFELHRDARATLSAWLRSRKCRQLVIVYYNPDHPVDQEWVYNQADIDRSKIVWARSVTAKDDRKLAQYFSEREVWQLQPDVFPLRLVPYAGAKAGCM